MELKIRSLKEIFPSAPGDIKDSATLKKALASDVDWRTTKEILVWVVDTDKGTLLLSLKPKARLISLLDTHPTHCRVAVKSLEHLINKLWSMHLAVPGSIGHFYTMQVALTSTQAANRTTAYLLA